MIEVKPRKRNYLPEDFQVTTWAKIKPYFTALLKRPINSFQEYNRFLEDHDELFTVIGEDSEWRMIRNSCHTNDKEIRKAYLHSINNLEPHFSEYDDLFNQKIISSRFSVEMKEPGFDIALKVLKTETELYREENIDLEAKEGQLVMQFCSIVGAMVVELDGQNFTLPQASDRFYLVDRNKREEAWIKSRRVMHQDSLRMDKVFDGLVQTRHQMALNAGCKNYIDYRFKKDRFDYTAKDCREFNESIRECVVPLIAVMEQKKATSLGLEKLRPWDGVVDPQNRPPIKAFKDAADLIEKTKIVLSKVHPDFGDVIQLMQDGNRLDLESRAHKEPGGYMAPLPETTTPFVFANVTQTPEDVLTMMHEGGHAVHEMMKKNLRLRSLYGNEPSEVSELASMSMELLTMDHWDVFYSNKEECTRVKQEHLERIVELFVSVAAIDEFQHEVYLQPDMALEQRHEKWADIQTKFETKVVDWSGFEEIRNTNWQNVHHVYGYPLYYIEYGIAQLGALQVWRNYKNDPEQTIKNYRNALSLGYTKTVPEIYEAAGVKFDFSKEMLGELMQFVADEMTLLEKDASHPIPTIVNALRPNS